MAKNTKLIVESYCNNCLGTRRHERLDVQKRDDVDDHGSLQEQIAHEFLRCCGCENVCMRQTYMCSGMEDPSISYFPPAVSRKMPEWLRGLVFFWDESKRTIRDLFAEVYSAMFSGNLRLALMGTRAIVDVALSDKLGGDDGPFKDKLKAAKDKGWLTQNDLNILNAAIDAGHAASHRAYKPDEKRLNYVLDIVEHFIQSLYILEESAQEVTAKTPQRAQKQKKPPNTNGQPGVPETPPHDASDLAGRQDDTQTPANDHEMHEGNRGED